MCSRSGGVFRAQGIDIFGVLGERGGLCGQAFHVSRKELADNFLILKEDRLLFPAFGSKGGGKKTNPPRDKD